MKTKIELVAFVRAHALENYDTGFWSWIVEAYDDAEIIEFLGSASTEAEALAAAKEELSIMDSRAQASGTNEYGTVGEW